MREWKRRALRGRCILNVGLFRFGLVLILLIHCPFGTCFLCFLLSLLNLDRERIALPCMYSIPSTHLDLFRKSVHQI